MVKGSTSQPQEIIAQSISVIRPDDREKGYFISAASDDYFSIFISESDNNSVVSTESPYLSPEEAGRVKQSLKEMKEGEYEDFANADELISNLKSDKD